MSTTTRIEKGMIFQPASIIGLQDGTKTMTRRIIKPQPMEDDLILGTELYYPEKVDKKTGEYYPGDEVFGIYTDNQGWVCPHPPGSVIWVKETWRPVAPWECRKDGATVQYRADGAYLYKEFPSDYPGRISLSMDGMDKWRSSMFMPRLAARLFLEVTAVKVERLQDISEADAIAEGITQDVAASIFRNAKGWKEPVAEAWLETKDGGSYDSGSYCSECAERIHYKNPSTELCGGYYMAHESDGPALCDECGAALHMSLSEYGIDSELRFTEGPESQAQYFSLCGESASIAHMIASGIGDLQERHMGRLAQIGFATLWDSINAKRPGCSWDANPWVWAYTMRKLEDYNG